MLWAPNFTSHFYYLRKILSTFQVDNTFQPLCPAALSITTLHGVQPIDWKVKKEVCWHGAGVRSTLNREGRIKATCSESQPSYPGHRTFPFLPGLLQVWENCCHTPVLPYIADFSSRLCPKSETFHTWISPFVTALNFRWEAKLCFFYQYVIKGVAFLVFCFAFLTPFSVDLKSLLIWLNWSWLKIQLMNKTHQQHTYFPVFLENSCTVLPTPAPAFMYQWQPVIHIGISPKSCHCRGRSWNASIL